MPRTVKVACTQFHAGEDPELNAETAERLVRAAAAAGAQIIVLQELFERPYWANVHSQDYYSWASPLEGCRLVERFAALARELRVVLPVSFFERENNVYFNSVAMVDADGSVMGVYRKSHIPDGPGYRCMEKYYVSPGDTGFRVYDTAHGRVGIAVCWDQWFPETARALALQGAEVIVLPSAIGSENHEDPQKDSYPHWVRVQQGHAAANMTPLVVSNRYGQERIQDSPPQTYYGGSFIAGPTGEILAQVGVRELSNGNPHPAPPLEEGFALASLDLDAIAAQRVAWGLFRDRRPELYGPLTTLSGGRPVR
ncbi:hypothetical protein HYH03_001369 [Edaphochlamys debaryana]|uniref:CN hydrolase domain-containing protein n=1 Tax=Edaphochlamys debaryana TaxID=47281 RepID=A0A835YGN7_9CHLO|nr:hypothetical protein HYH03_001369 [Edaphochlamys debaryana]|eukprot:KAG2500601.1 hypothetical protein HYH03_001369 [Edaphochlamys debaryana]